MAKKFYAVHRETGERWKPDKKYTKKRETTQRPYGQYLVMYDSGHLAVITVDFYVYIEPLDPAKWKIIHSKGSGEHAGEAK